MSWGSPNKEEKFYKGAKNDTAWNKDLLWRYHVAKETKQTKVNAGELPSPDPTLKMRHVRMKMGITGTLIPDITPRYDDMASFELALHSPSSRKNLNAEMTKGDDTRSVVTRARSVRSSASLKSSASSSLISTSSSTKSIHIEDIQQLVNNQSRLFQETTHDEIIAMRRALDAEAGKREAAEKRLSQLCEKLGL